MTAWAASAPPARSQSANDGFDPNVNGMVWALALQADGRILLGGDFTFVGGRPHSGIARLNVDGSLDSSFNLEAFNPGANIGLRAVVVQADGKILVGGAFTMLGGQARTNIGRFNADGSLDIAFNPGASAGSYGTVYSLAVQADGKIVVGGDFRTLSGQSRTNIGRLNPDGSVDDLFDPGATLGSCPACGPVIALAVQPDGRILVAGYFTSLGGQPHNRVGRLNADGSADSSFHPGTGADYPVRNLALQADGRIVIGGYFTSVDGQSRSNIARLNPDGTLDATFNPGANGPLDALAVQTDGKILVGGQFTELGGQPRAHFGRLNPDGGPDMAFNPGAGTYETVASLVQQSDGNILVGGSFTTLGGTNRNNLGRLYLDGSLDATFNPLVTLLNSAVMGLALAADQEILVGGAFEGITGQPRTNIARLKADGSPDLAFNPGAPYAGLVRGFITQPDGKIVVAGMGMRILGGQAVTNIGRLNPDGSFDPSFSASVEFICIVEPCQFTLNGLAAQADGKILVCGHFNRVNGQVRRSLARLNADGSLDTGFTADATPGEVRSVAVQPDGRLVVGGNFRTMNGQPATNLCRLNLDGSLDTAFASSAGEEVFALAVQADGKILVGGTFEALGGQPRTRVGRLLVDGSADPEFAPFVSYASNSPAVYSLALQTDGRILVGGTFTNLAGQSRTHLGRLNPDGSVAPGFDVSVDPVNVGSLPTVDGLAIQADGKIVVGGWFVGLGGQPRSRIGRLTTGTAALQTLVINADGTVAAWMRSGSSPEVEQVTFERSMDGTNYTTLGPATRIAGGWELAGFSSPVGQNFYLRARGRAVGGMCNGSGSLIESVRQFYSPPRITSVAKLEDGSLTLRGAGPASQPCVLLTASNLLPPPAWSPIATNTADTNGLVIFPDLTTTNSPTRFYQLRWP